MQPVHFIIAEMHLVRFITAEMHFLRFIIAEMHHATFTRFRWVSRYAYQALVATAALPAVVHHCAARPGLISSALLCSFVRNFGVSAMLVACGFIL